MSVPLTIEADFHILKAPRGRRVLATGEAPPLQNAVGRVPRVSKLMALAIRFQTLLESGQVRDYAELARLGHVTRARITQIMNLLLLAPHIQEELLFLPRVHQGRDPLTLRDMQTIALTPDWKKQQCNWKLISKKY